MKFSHIIEKVTYNPWLITAGGYKSVAMLVKAKLDGGIKADGFDDLFPERSVTATIDQDGIAHIPIDGVLGHRLSGIEKMCGGTDYLDVQRVTQDAIDNKGARGVLFSIDSPGGMVRGCTELASYIKGLSVPTGAYSDSQCCSAAYWLASACGDITASESSDIGSIGVILPWVDESKVWELEGLKYDPFTNEGADLKGTGGGPSLSDKQKTYLQDSVNYVGKQFQDFVSGNRSVEKEVFRAGTYFGKQALNVGLVDSVGGYSDAHLKLLTRVRSEPKSLVPVPVGNKPKIQGKQMTKEELMTQHPELFKQLQDDQATAAKAAQKALVDGERARLSALDALAFTPECEPLVAAAKADGRQANDIAVEIAAVVAKDRDHLATQVGVLKGGRAGAAVGAVDPNQVEDQGTEQAMAQRLTAVFQRKIGGKALNSRN